MAFCKTCGMLIPDGASYCDFHSEESRSVNYKPVDDTAGFFSALFELSFEQSITIKLTKVMFVIAIAFWGLMGFFMFIAGMNSGGSGAIGGLIMGPIIFIVGVVVSRIFFEAMILLHKLLEVAKQIRDK